MTIALLALGLGASACDRGLDDDEFAAIRDTTSLVESMGEVALTEDGAIRGEVTSGMYRRWSQAKQALQGAGVSLPSAQKLRGYGNDDVQRLVSQLEGNSKARSAITGTGMSVQDFVVTGVALERQLALATGPQRQAFEREAAAPVEMPVEPVPQVLDDTLFIPSQPLPPSRSSGEQPLPPLPTPVDPRQSPRIPAETTPPRPVPSPIPEPRPTPRPAPRDTVRLEPIPTPEPSRPAEPRASAEPVPSSAEPASNR